MKKLRFTPAERRIFRRRKPMHTSEWAQKHRVLTMSAIPGPWRNEITPYLSGIMDAADIPCIREIYLCAAPQTGKSEAVHNCIGKKIDREPGPVLYVYPDETTARENSRDRILPMIRSSRQLSTFLTGERDDESVMRINLSHLPIYLAWARSAARLANKPIRYVVLDEVDKYPETAGKREADPISLARKRTVTYSRNHKIWMLSTPTTETGNITRAIAGADGRFDYTVACPECGGRQQMDFRNIHWPAPPEGSEEKRIDPETLEKEKSAWYECYHCGTHWDDARRDMAVRSGEWIERKSGLTIRAFTRSFSPRTIGFHVPSWLSTFVSMSTAAASFLRGLQDKTAMKDFKNNHAAEPWQEIYQERKEDAVLALADDRPAGRVPTGEIAGLTAGVDTQDNGFWYEIRAWGYGLTAESWQIRAGFVDSFMALEQILFQDQYTDGEGRIFPVLLTLQDAMGHRTAEVYDFARRHRGLLLPSQGVARMNQPFTYTNIEYYPQTGKLIPGGLKLVRVNTNYFKSRLAGKLEILPTDPGAWHLHSETTEEWARHMTAEAINPDTGMWECQHQRANHGWDCSVLNLVAAEISGFRYRKPREEKADRSNDKPQPTPQKGRRPNWFQNR